MKIFGIDFTTKTEQELKQKIADLEFSLEEITEERDTLDTALTEQLKDFPFELGQVVYDIALKNSKGRYTTTAPSYEHSTVTMVTVDKNNYFNLVDRLKRKDVFFSAVEADEHLRSICN